MAFYVIVCVIVFLPVFYHWSNLLDTLVIGSGFSLGLSFLYTVEVRQLANRRRRLPSQGVRVAAHGKVNIGMPHQVLSLFRVNTSRRQQAPESMSQGVKVHNPGIGFPFKERFAFKSLVSGRSLWVSGLNPFHPCRLKVITEHSGHIGRAGHGKRRGLWQFASHMGL